MALRRRSTKEQASERESHGTAAVARGQRRAAATQRVWVQLHGSINMVRDQTADQVLAGIDLTRKRFVVTGNSGIDSKR